MDASQLRYPESVPSVPKHKFCIFLPVEGLWNTPKHYQISFGSNGDVSRLWYPEIVYWGSDASFASCYLSKVSEMIRNTPKHSQTSFWVQWSRMDASQLRYPESVPSVPKHKFCIFLPVEGWWNALKHSQTSFWVPWSRMDATQLRYPKTVHSVLKHKFCIFLHVEG
jgi:hypothetical protein